MSVGRNLKEWDENRCLDDAFGSCWVGIHRLDKKIERWKFLDF
jgi:hypothetical protein